MFLTLPLTSGLLLFYLFLMGGGLLLGLFILWKIRSAYRKAVREIAEERKGR